MITIFSQYYAYSNVSFSVSLKYVLWGASVGKFEKNPAALSFYKNHLSKVDLFIVREKISMDYLHYLSIDKPVVLAPDPAYFVAPEVKRVEKLVNNRIGINLSPLSALYEYKDLLKAIKKQTQAIISLIDAMNVEVILLPHVISPYYIDNDLSYMRDIYDELPFEYQSKVSLIDTDPSFIGLKKEIMKCDYVIAARMHCAVNAISTGIPAVFLAYSEKAKGMAEYIYGSQVPVMALTKFEDTSFLIQLLEKWNFHSNLEEFRNYDYKMIFK